MFSQRLERAIKRRKTEIIVTIVLFILAVSLLFYTFAQPNELFTAQLSEKLSFAMIVALFARWVSVLFTEAEFQEDTEKNDYYEAIKHAKKRIWIAQTYLPGLESEAGAIAKNKPVVNQDTTDKELRIMLASFKEGSPIFARIAGREMEPDEAKTNVAGSVRTFVSKGHKDCLRFNYGHHPGWIAVIDSVVFWGPTPVDRDNHLVDFLWGRYGTSTPKGTFWVAQFEELWNKFSQDFDAESEYNEKLRKLRDRDLRVQ